MGALIEQLIDAKADLTPIFSEVLSVRMSDLNYANHLDFSSLVKMMGDVRALFFKRNGFDEFNIDGCGIITTDVHVTYKTECYLDDELDFKITVTRTGKIKINLNYLIVNFKKGIEVATGIITLAFYNYERKKPVQIPKEFLAFSNLSKE